MRSGQAREFVGRRRREQHREIQHLGPRHVGPLDPLQQVVPADDLVQGAEAHPGEDVPHLFGQQGEVADDLLRRALELGAQVFALGRDAGRAGVDVALPGHGAAHRHEGCGAEAVRLGAQQRRDHDVASGLEPAVGSHLDPVAQPVPHQRGLRLRQPQFPRRAGVLDGGER